jgi:predicted nucleic acid-binding protein
MILIDTSFIVGVISASDRLHTQCLRASASITEEVITTWSCITEAMYLLKHPQAKETPRLQIEAGLWSVYSPQKQDLMRACELMRLYADTPMDFADASLVALAEALNIRRILTWDRHFYAYLIHNEIPFEVLLR